MNLPSDHATRPSPRRIRWVWWAFAAIAAYYLLTEHRAHLAGLLSWLPFGLLLLCPLMHVFMHGGHGHGGRGTQGRARRDVVADQASGPQQAEHRHPSPER